MSIMTIIFCIFGFYLGKRIYQSRKLKANELYENFEYDSSDEKKNIELEMGLKI